MLNQRFTGFVGCAVLCFVVIIVDIADKNTVVLVFFVLYDCITDIDILNHGTGHLAEKWLRQSAYNVIAAVILEILSFRISLQLIDCINRLMFAPVRERNVGNLLEISAHFFFAHHFQLIEIINQIRIVLRTASAAVLDENAV